MFLAIILFVTMCYFKTAVGLREWQTFSLFKVNVLFTWVYRAWFLWPVLHWICFNVNIIFQLYLILILNYFYYQVHLIPSWYLATPTNLRHFNRSSASSPTVQPFPCQPYFVPPCLFWLPTGSPFYWIWWRLFLQPTFLFLSKCVPSQPDSSTHYVHSFKCMG